MKRLLLLSFVAMSLFACKDDKKDTPAPSIDYKDPKVLSGALTIKSGTAVAATMPVGNNAAGAPVLAEEQNNEIVPAISGRYVVVTPQLVSGTFKGYYVKVVGADNYFKIEFPAKAGGRKAADRKHGFLRAGSEDSLIVIKLPEGLNIDTFKIQYAVYDSSNVVSNVITNYVAVLKPAGGSDGAALVGTWENTRHKSPNATEWTNTIGKDTSWANFKCVEGKLQYNMDGTPFIVNIYNTIKDQGILNANGSLTWESVNTYSSIDQNNSTCDKVVYRDGDDSYADKGGWSYIAATKELIFVGDYDGQAGVGDFFVTVYKVTEVSATKITIDDDGYITELTKK